MTKVTSVRTHLPDAFAATTEGERAEEILRACVHCGFCNATCPTYQLLGDELDGPRGRIYLLKDMLETSEVTETATRHLDRCLTCLSCETTCPSGVRYGELLEIGRARIEAAGAPGSRGVASATATLVRTSAHQSAKARAMGVAGAPGAPAASPAA